MSYPKYKGGGYIVRTLLEDSTYGKIRSCLLQCYITVLLQSLGYVDELFTQLWKVLEKGSERIPRTTSPPPLCSSFEKPVKEEAIIQHKTRFSKL